MSRFFLILAPALALFWLPGCISFRDYEFGENMGGEQRDAYDRLQPSREDLPEVKAWIRNDYLSLWVAEDGRYVLWAESESLKPEDREELERQSKNVKEKIPGLSDVYLPLMYSSSFYDRRRSATYGPWSSYTLIQVGNEVKKFHELPTVEKVKKKRSKIEDERRQIITITKEFGPVHITQTHFFYSHPLVNADPDSEGERLCRIQYLVELKDPSAEPIEDFGLRVMLDTWAGYNDGVPFRLSRDVYDLLDENNVHAANQFYIVKNEKLVTLATELKNDQIQTFEGRGGRIPLVAFFDFEQYGGAMLPDHVVLSTWPKVYDLDGDLDPDFHSEDTLLTDDSAISVFWNNLIVYNQETFQFGYGTTDQHNIIYYDRGGIQQPIEELEIRAMFNAEDQDYSERIYLNRFPENLINLSNKGSFREENRPGYQEPAYYQERRVSPEDAAQESVFVFEQIDENMLADALELEFQFKREDEGNPLSIRIPVSDPSPYGRARLEKYLFFEKVRENTRQLKIFLAADDDEAGRYLVRFFLDKEGRNAVEAVMGADAVEAVMGADAVENDTDSADAPGRLTSRSFTSGTYEAIYELQEPISYDQYYNIRHTAKVFRLAEGGEETELPWSAYIKSVLFTWTASDGYAKTEGTQVLLQLQRAGGEPEYYLMNDEKENGDEAPNDGIYSYSYPLKDLNDPEDLAQFKGRILLVEEQ